MTRPATTQAAPCAILAEYDQAALDRLYETISFAPPFVMLRRRSDGARGTMLFRRDPRRYYGWQAENGFARFLLCGAVALAWTLASLAACAWPVLKGVRL